MSDYEAFSYSVLSFTATYLLHSTAFIILCWITVKGARVTSHFLIERMWKLAGVLGLISSLVQIGTGIGFEVDFAEWISVRTPMEAPHKLSKHTSPNETESREPFVLRTETERVVTKTLGQDRHFDSKSADLESSVTDLATVTANSDNDWANSTDQFETSAVVETFTTTRRRRSNATAESRSHWPIRTIATFAAFVSTSFLMTFVGGALVLSWRSLSLRRRLLNASELEKGPVRAALDSFLKRNGVRRSIKLVVSTRESEPFTFGLFKWTIVLPTRVVEHLGADELKALLAHEVAHLVRGDAYWLWIGQVLCTCLALQPLNFIARRGWQRAAECLCDDWAVRQGIRPTSLAKCLAHIAEWRIAIHPCAVGLPAGGTKSTLVHRVERLLNREQRPDCWTTTRSRRLVNAITVIAILLAIALAPQLGMCHPHESTRKLKEQKSELHVVAGGHLLTTQPWEALEAEFLQLDEDLVRLDALLATVRQTSRLESLKKSIEKHSKSLRSRRDKLSSLLLTGKDSDE